MSIGNVNGNFVIALKKGKNQLEFRMIKHFKFEFEKH